MPTVHKLKILPAYFQAVWDGTKTFELRKFDREYKVGDTIVLEEWNGREYTGSSICKRISYILSNCSEYGLEDGFCILGLSDYTGKNNSLN